MAVQAKGPKRALKADKVLAASDKSVCDRKFPLPAVDSTPAKVPFKLGYNSKT